MNPLESRPEDTDSESDSDWEEEGTQDDGNIFDVFKHYKTSLAFGTSDIWYLFYLLYY